MKAFLLAAGFGERMRPITETIPKPLIPVLNIPSICYAVAIIKEAGIKDIVCNVHHLPDMITSFFDDHENFGLNIQFSVEEEILGTGGGLMKCRSLLGDDNFLLINSDIISDVQISDVIDAFNKSGNDGMMVLVRGSGHDTVSVVNEKIVDINNMASSGVDPCYDYAGISVLSPAVFDYLKPDFSCVVRTGFMGLLEKSFMGWYEHHGLWKDIGTIERFRKASVELIKTGRSLGKRVHEATDLEPLTLDPGAEIDENATISQSIIGKSCRVGSGVIVEESVLLPGAVAREGEQVIRRVVIGSPPTT